MNKLIKVSYPGLSGLLILVITVFFSSSVQAARLFSSGFETQSVTNAVEWDSFTNSPSISTSVMQGGAASLQANPSASTKVAKMQTRTNSTNAVYARFYIYVSSAPSTTTSVFRYGDGTTQTNVRIRMDTSRNLELWNGSAQIGSDSATLSTSTWYRVEIAYLDASSDVCTAYLNGSQFATGTCGNVNGGGAIEVGVMDTATADLYFDDIAVNDNQGSSQTSFPAKGKIVHLLPTSAGDNAATSGLFSAVDEVPPDDTDYIEMDTNTTKPEYNVTDSSTAGIASTDLIRLVEVHARVREESAGNSDWGKRLKSAASGTTTTVTRPDTGDATWRTDPSSTTSFGLPLISYTDPTTGVAWTPTGTNSLDNMQIGTDTTDGNPDVWVSAIWALVEYWDGVCNDIATGSWSSTTTWDCYEVPNDESATIDSHTVTLARDSTANNVTISGGTLATSTYTLKTTGSWTYSSGTFTPSTGSIMFAGTGSKTITSGGAVFNNVTINDGLIGYWKLDSTTDMVDYSGYGNTGTLNGNPTTSTMRPTLNYANAGNINFDGTGDYIRVPNSSLFTTSSVTLTGWVYLTQLVVAGQWGAIITKQVGTSFYESYNLMIHQDGYLHAHVGETSGCHADSAAGTISTGRWYHVASTADANNIKVYINGSEVDSEAGCSWNTDSNDVIIGGSENAATSTISDLLNGRIDDVRLYNRVLSAAEIATLASGSPSTGTGTYTLQDNIDINGDLTLATGTLDAKSGSNYDITLASDWFNYGGTFTPRSGEVILDANTAHSIAGQSTFYDFSYTESSNNSTDSTLTFDASSTQTINGTLTLDGLDSDDMINLVSTDATVRFTLSVATTQSVDFVDVSDSQASGADIETTNSTENNNTDSGEAAPHWVFVQVLASGTVYSDQGVTGISNVFVQAAINGTLGDTDTTDGSGDYEISVSVLAGDVVTLYLSGESTNAVTMIVSGGSTIDADLYADHFIVDDEDDGTITSEEIDTGEVGDSDDVQAILNINGTTNVLTMVTGTELYIKSGATLSIDATVKAHDIEIVGTLVDNGEKIFVSGSWDMDALGSYTATGLVMLHGTTSETVVSDGVVFNNLTLNDGLIGYWKLDETAEGNCATGDGKDACDSSGYGNHGEWIGTPAAVTNRPVLSFHNPYSLDLDGSSYVSVPHTTQFNITGDLTIAMWIKADAFSGFQGLLAKVDGSSQWDYDLYLENDSLRLYGDGMTPDGVVASTTLGDTNKWYHVAMTRSANTVTFYVDGAAAGSFAMSGSFQARSNGIFLGADTSGGNTELAGLMDDVRLYNRTLSSTEIGTLASGAPGVGRGTYTLEDALDVNGDLTLLAGTLDTKSGEDNAITVASDWFNYGGILTPRSGTVTFDASSNHAIAGNTTFNNLSYSEASDNSTDSTLTFDASSTQTIGGTLTLDGLDSDDMINLVSTDATVRFTLSVATTQSADYVDVSDSQVSGADIETTNSTENNNTDSGEASPHWVFVQVLASGTVYSDEGSTPIASVLVQAAVNGTIGNTDTTDGSGDYEISGSASAGDVVTLYLSGESTNAVTMVVSDGDPIDADLYADRLIVIDNDNGTITSEEIDTGEVNDSDDVQAILNINGTTNVLTMVTGTEIYIPTGATLSIDATVEAHDIEIVGTLVDNGENVFVSGSWDMDAAGTYTETGTVILSSAATTETITSAGEAFNNLTINDGLVGYWKLDETAANSCTGGTNDSCDSSGYGRDGAWGDAPSPTVDKPRLNFNNLRALNFDGSNDYVSAGNILNFLKTDTLSFTAWVKSTVGKTVLAKWNVTVTPGYEFDIGALDTGKLGFGFYNSDGTAGYARYGGTNLLDGAWHHVAITYSGSAAVTGIKLYVDGVEESYSTWLNTDPGAMSNTDFRIGNRETSNYLFNGAIDDVRAYNRVLSSTEILELARGNQPGTATGKYTLQDALDVNGNLTLAGGTLDTKSGSNYGINLAGSWLNYGGDFTARSGTVTLDGTSSGKILQSDGNNQSFNNLTLNGSGGEWTMYDNAGIGGTLTLTAGLLTHTTLVDTVKVGGNMTVNGGTFTGVKKGFAIDGNLTLTSGIFTGPSDLLMLSGTFTRSAATFNDNSGTVMFTAPNAFKTITSNTESFNDVTIGDGLVGYWKLDETAANSCSGGSNDSCDSSGNGNDGAWGGAPSPSTNTPKPFRFANERSLSFDGTDDYINVGDLNALDGISELTVSMWVNVTTLEDYTGFFGKTSSGDGNNRIMLIAGGSGAGDNTNILAGVANGSNSYGYTSVANLTAGVWIHLSMVFNGNLSGDANRLKVYVNGVQQSLTFSTTIPSATPSTTYPVTIGVENNGGSPYAAAKIDDVRIYNRALSADEVKLLAQAKVLGSTTGTVTLEDTMDVNDDLVLASGTFDTKSGENNLITLGGDWTNTGASFLSRSNTVTFDGGSTQTLNAGGTGTGVDDTTKDFNNVKVTGSTVQLSGTEAEIDGTLTINSGKTYDINGINTTIATLSNSGTVKLQIAETVSLSANDYDSGTWEYVGDGTSQQILAAVKDFGSTNPDYYNLTFNDTSASNSDSFILIAALTIDGSMRITDGEFLTNNKNITVKGSWINGPAGAFSASTGAVLMTGTTSAGTITTSGQSFNDLTINDGLVGYWKLDETAEGGCTGGVLDACDSSGYGTHGEWIDTPTAYSTTPRVNFHDPGALNFDGTNDYIDFGGTLPWESNTLGTITAWIRLDAIFGSDGVAEIISYGDTDAATPCAMNFDVRRITGTGGNTRIDVTQVNGSNGTITGIYGSTNLTADRWYHVAVVSSGSAYSLYVDGIAESLGDWQGTGNNGNWYADSNCNGTEKVLMGAGLYTTVQAYFDGKIDEVRIYNRVLSAAEILELARGNQPGTATGTYTLQDALDVNGNLTLAGGTLDTKSGSNYGITLAGSWLNYGGDFTARSGTVTLDGTASGKILQSDGNNQSFNNLTLNGSGGEWMMYDNVGIGGALTLTAGVLSHTTLVDTVKVGGAMTVNGGTFTGVKKGFAVDGDLTLTSGTFTAPSDILMLSGDFTRVAATFADNSGNVIFTSTDAETITSNTESFNDVVVGDGLIAYWKLDETAANTCAAAKDACDSSGDSSHDGEWNNSPTPSENTPKPFRFTNSRSMSFNGTSQYIQVDDTIDPGKEATISAWIKSTQSTRGDIVAKLAGANLGYVLKIENGLVGFWVGDNTNGYTSSSATVNDGVWHHLVGTYDGTNARIYIDGVLNATAARIGQLDVTAATSIGYCVACGSNYFSGSIDDLRIYARALSADEVIQLAQAKTLGTADGTFTLEDTFDINDDFIMARGTLDTKSGENNAITVGGDWKYVGGIFTPRSGTVTLDASTDHAIYGSTTFNNLSYTESSNNSTDSTLTFQATTTQTIGGTLTLDGLDSDDMINLVSTDSTVRYTLSVSTTQNVDYVDVSDSQVSGTRDIRNTGGVDNNNTDSGDASPHWVFISVSDSNASFIWATGF